MSKEEFLDRLAGKPWIRLREMADEAKHGISDEQTRKYYFEILQLVDIGELLHDEETDDLSICAWIRLIADKLEEADVFEGNKS